MFSAQKLLLGKLAVAWSEYPQTRRDIASVPAGKPILVTGTHRSGSTWFGSMLAASGIWHIHEPFAPYKELWHEWFTYARADEENTAIDRLMRKLLTGGHRQALQMPWVEHALMPLRLLPQPIKRVLIKDPIACLMSEYLTQHFDMQTFVLFRHPAAFVESVTRLGWPQCGGIDSFLENEKLMCDFLEPYRELMISVRGEEGVRTATVMHACLNTVLWGFTNRNTSMKCFQFEALCENPLDAFRGVFSEASLPYGETTRIAHARLCFTDQRGVNRPHAVNRMSEKMAYGWRDRLSVDDLSSIRSIWEQFDIPLYKDRSDWQV